MAEPTTKRASTQVSKIIKAPRKAVYQACLDPKALASWRVPDNMKAQLHVFEAREGGTYRMSLTYLLQVQEHPKTERPDLITALLSFNLISNSRRVDT